MPSGKKKTTRNGNASTELKVTEKAYTTLEELLKGLPELQEDQGPQQVAFALPKVHRAEVKATMLLTATNRRWSLLKRSHREWKRTIEIKIRTDMADQNNLELQFVTDAEGEPTKKRRSKEERRQYAEALHYQEKDSLDDKFDEAEEVGLYRESVQATLKTIEHYRQDLNKYLRSLELARELGEPSSVGGGGRKK